MTIATDFSGGIDQVIKVLGNNVTYTDNAGTTHNVRMAISTVGKDDGAVVNALGLDARIGYIKPMTPAPQKFDNVSAPSGEVFTVHDVNAVMVDSAVVGYKLVMQA